MGGLQIEARIANPPESLLAKYSRREKDFFYEYASLVHRLLTNRQIGERLSSLIDKERINVRKAIDVRIMVFPARPLTGRFSSTLHGSYNQDAAQISLYPLKVPREWIRKEGSDFFKKLQTESSQAKRRLFGEICESAVSTLVHEILHVKLEERSYSRYAEEAIVRKLERQYFQELFPDTSIFHEAVSPVTV